MTASKAGVGAAKANLASAQEASKAKASEITNMVDVKAKLDATMKDHYEGLKTAKGTAGAVHQLEKVLRDIGLEAGLVDSVEGTFRKKPEERGTFDALVAKHIEDQVGKFIAKSDGVLQAAEQ